MTLSTLAEIGLGLVLIGVLCFRQLRWTAVQPGRMWRLPAVLGIAGLVGLTRSGATVVSATDLALLLVEAVVAVTTGALMGRVAVFRPISAAAAPARRPGEPAPTLETRTGWMGVALWAVLIGARIALGLVGHELGAVLTASTGVILLTIALNRAARNLVVAGRLGGAPALMGRR
jgi:hypothetical protein